MQAEQRRETLAAHRVGYAEHRRGGDCRMPLEDALDRLGMNVLSGDDDHPLGAADEVEIPVRVEIAHVYDRHGSPRAQHIVLAAEGITGEDQGTVDEDEARTTRRQPAANPVRSAVRALGKGAVNKCGTRGW